LATSSDVLVTVPLAESLGNTVVRVAQSIAVPAFSETIVPVRTNRSGLSLSLVRHIEVLMITSMQRMELWICLRLAKRSSAWFQPSPITRLHCERTKSSGLSYLGIGKCLFARFKMLPATFVLTRVYYASRTVAMIRSGHFFRLGFSPSSRRAVGVDDLIFYLVTRSA
jgi:hypothetical protein